MNPPDWFLILQQREGQNNLLDTTSAFKSGKRAAQHGTVFNSADTFVERHKRYGVVQAMAFVEGYNLNTTTAQGMRLRAAYSSAYKRVCHFNRLYPNSTYVPASYAILSTHYSPGEINLYRAGENKTYGDYYPHPAIDGPTIDLGSLFPYLYLQNNHNNTQNVNPNDVIAPSNNPPAGNINTSLVQQLPGNPQPMQYLPMNNTVLSAYQMNNQNEQINDYPLYALNNWVMNNLPPYIIGYHFAFSQQLLPGDLFIQKNYSLLDSQNFFYGYLEGLNQRSRVLAEAAANNAVPHFPFRV